MRAWIIASAALSLLVPTLAAADLLDLGEFGFGAYGVVDVPLAQEDASPGPMFGAKVRMGLLPQLAVEASATFVRDRDSQTVSGGDLPAPNLNSFSLGLVTRGAAPGLTIAVSAGLGLAQVDYPGAIGSRSGFAWNLGVGLEVPVGPVTLDAGPRLLVVNTGDAGSRKHLGVVTGISYFFD